MADLQQIIEQAFENRAEITPENVTAETREAVLAAIELLDSGQQRVAEPVSNGWQVNEWLKKAVLLSFRIRENQIMPGGFTQYYDKVDSKFDGCTVAQHTAGGMHWQTLEKVLTHPEPPGYQFSKPRPKRKIGPYLERIRQIIKDDAKIHRKQRHTAKRIFERLQEEG